MNERKDITNYQRNREGAADWIERTDRALVKDKHRGEITLEGQLYS